MSCVLFVHVDVVIWERVQRMFEGVGVFVYVVMSGECVMDFFI